MFIDIICKQSISISQGILCMSSVERYIEILKGNFYSRLEKNSKYSLRAFARDIGLSPSRLSEIFNNKGDLSERSSINIAKKLGLTILEQDIFTALVILANSKSKSKKEKAYSFINSQNMDSFTSISSDKFKVIANWYYFGIVTVMELDDFDGTSEFISNELGLSSEIIDDAILKLINVGIVGENTGLFFLKENNLTTSHNVYSTALRSSHKQSLNQAIEALDTISVEFQDITSMMMAIDVSKLDEAKLKIKEFRRGLSNFLEAGKKNKAYQLNIQLIPLNTKRGFNNVLN